MQAEKINQEFTRHVTMQEARNSWGCLVQLNQVLTPSTVNPENDEISYEIIIHGQQKTTVAFFSKRRARVAFNRWTNATDKTERD